MAAKNSSPSSPTPGVIRADEAYLLTEVKRRMRWRDHAVRQARRKGLRVIRWRRQADILGRDLISFLDGIGNESE